MCPRGTNGINRFFWGGNSVANENRISSGSSGPPSAAIVSWVFVEQECRPLPPERNAKREEDLMTSLRAGWRIPVGEGPDDPASINRKKLRQERDTYVFPSKNPITSSD
ncbi:hypothetical protein CEXT_493381 [Caerostris extrusa]|uniref:Uncharacterized protein n=1 Tax=Caerostris extrusa TaxID=172846 RepID=A0AAV4XWG3_CAEEX|nr:hypothetical protein CEXT_493381 [Caerostris extrusa]